MNEQLHNFFFLCACLQPQSDETEILAIRKMILEESVCWERVIKCANLAYVTPALWTALMQKGLQESVPEDVAGYLKELHRLNQERNHAIHQQIGEITAALNHVGVEPLLLKGAALLFGDSLEDPASRMMIDIDFMVSSEDISKVQDVLHGLCYDCPAHDSSRYLFASHLPPLCRTADPASIEVHTGLFHRYDDPEVLTASEVLGHAVSIRMNGLAARILSPAHAVIFNIVHSEVHHENFDLGRILLRDLLDFVVMTRVLSASLDWPSIRARLEQHKLAHVGESYIYMAHKLLRNPVPPGFAPGAGTASHYARCLFVVGWPRIQEVFSVGTLMRVVRLFSAERMRRHFGCSDSGLDLAKARFAYLWYLIRNSVSGAKGRTLAARVNGKSVKNLKRPTDHNSDPHYDSGDP